MHAFSGYIQYIPLLGVLRNISYEKVDQKCRYLRNLSRKLHHIVKFTHQLPVTSRGSSCDLFP